MKHSLVSFEKEIVQQILISELCFEVCRSTFGPPGLGSHFTPYFYNLNFQKGIDSLHSLLLSKDSNELSINNYIKLYKETHPEKDISNLKEESVYIAEMLKGVAPFSLRNKIGSHLDGDFTHADFMSGYLMPEIVEHLNKIVKDLKELIFPFTEHSLADNPHGQLMKQIYKIIDQFTIEYAKNLSGSK